MTFETTTAYQLLYPYFGTRVRRDEPLARHSTFGVGGPADIWVVVETKDELLRLVSLCAEMHWPLLIVGNGSNTIFTEAGVRGIVAHMALTTYHLEESREKTLLVADAGVSWPSLVHECVSQGWGGLEFGIGIPGTLGGAVVSNAGAHNREIGEALDWIEILDARGANNEGDGYSYPLVRRYTHDELDLGYRHSRFRIQRQASFDRDGHLLLSERQMIDPAEIIVRMGLVVRHEIPGRLEELLAHYRRERASTEPTHSLRGSIFKNPSGEEVQALITQVGMQGIVRGQAQLANNNANYIINLGNAKAADMLWLIEEAHRRVLEHTGIELQLEVEIMGTL